MVPASEALFQSGVSVSDIPNAARVLLVLGVGCVVCPCRWLQVREGLRQGEGGSVPYGSTRSSTIRSGPSNSQHELDNGEASYVGASLFVEKCRDLKEEPGNATNSVYTGKIGTSRCLPVSATEWAGSVGRI